MATEPAEDRFVREVARPEVRPMISAKEALKKDPTGLFTKGPADGGLSATIEQVLDAHEREGRPSRKHLNTAHFKTRGNDVRILVDTKYFDEGLFPAIHEAKRYIVLAALCFGDDPLGKALVRMLKEKLKAGVQVAITVEDHFGWKTFQPVAAELEAAGAQIFHARLRKTGVEHRKACVVDGERAFLGGTCLEGPSYWSKNFQKALETGIAPMKNGQVDLLPPAKDIPEWHDMQVEVRGPAAQQLAADLLLSVLYHGGTLDPMGLGSRDALRDFWFPKLEPTGTTEVVIGQAVPLQRNTVQASGRATIALAKRSLYLHAAYFTSRDFFKEIEKALERGVDVHIGMPGGFDSKPHHYAYRWGLGRLFAKTRQEGSGALHVFEYKKDLEQGRSGYNHDKWIVADEEYVWTSTGNPELFSKYAAFDASLTTKDKAIAGELIQLFEDDAGLSDEITAATLDGRSTREKIVTWFFGVLSSLLELSLSPLRASDEVY